MGRTPEGLSVSEISDNLRYLLDEVIDSSYVRHRVRYGSYIEQSPQHATMSADTVSRLEARMPFAVTEWYQRIACRSQPAARLVSPRSDELISTAGQPYPAEAKHYSPVKGVQFEYPSILRIAVAATCSAHCRYCSQHAALMKPAQHPEASVENGAGHTAETNHLLPADIDETADFILSWNSSHRSSSPRWAITEVVLSGGDPMVLSNTKLFAWIGRLADVGIEVIRIGTKELAFFPDRFDDAFFSSIDCFRRRFPSTRLAFVMHITHPDEVLATSLENQPLNELTFTNSWLEEPKRAVARLRQRSEYVSLENQTPVIREVNDNVRSLVVLQRQMFLHGIVNHYLFQCRPIIGRDSFAVPIEECASLVRASQSELTGLTATARYVLSTAIGKLEVAGTMPGNVTGTEPATVFTVARAPYEANYGPGTLIVVKSNPAALWIDGYADRVLFDGTGKLVELSSTGFI